jgi:hypothetical protein
MGGRHDTDRVDDLLGPRGVRSEHLGSSAIDLVLDSASKNHGSLVRGSGDIEGTQLRIDLEATLDPLRESEVLVDPVPVRALGARCEEDARDHETGEETGDESIAESNASEFVHNTA